MRARYYNVDIKRFVNQDVLTGSIESSPSLNRYAYVEGNPVSFLDPFGLNPVDHDKIANAINIIQNVLSAIQVAAQTLGIFFLVTSGNIVAYNICSVIAEICGYGSLITCILEIVTAQTEAEKKAAIEETVFNVMLFAFGKVVGWYGKQTVYSGKLEVIPDDENKLLAAMVDWLTSIITSYCIVT